MTKEITNLKSQISNKLTEMKDAIDGKELDKAKVLKSEIENLNTELELAEFNYQEAKKRVATNGDPIKPENGKSEESEFLNAVRGKSFDNNLIKGDDPSGGYTVPRDIQTQINEFRKRRDMLSPLVRTEPVTTFEGARTFKARAQQTGFVSVAELEQFPEKATPQFERLTYKIEKYAGFFVASSEVLADSDQALTNVLVEWIGNESRVTRNKLILDALGQKTRTTIASPDDMLRAMQVTLDPAFQNTTTIVTNQSGFHWLSTLRYEDGRAMLQEIMAFDIPFRFAGRPVVVLSDNDFPNAGGQAPMIIGDLNEGCVVFDRQQLSIRHTDTGGNTFLTDSHIWRAIDRLDAKLWDEEAFVYGMVPAAVAPQGEQMKIKKAK